MGMILPIVLRRRVKGANAKNWPGLVLIHPDCPLPAAVLAQEAWESRHKMNPVNLVQTLFSTRARRRMEVMGHECEVQAAALIYGKDANAYRYAEAKRMSAGYGSLFKGMSVDSLMAAMAYHGEKAGPWVCRNRKFFERWK